MSGGGAAWCRTRAAGPPLGSATVGQLVSSRLRARDATRLAVGLFRPVSMWKGLSAQPSPQLALVSYMGLGLSGSTGARSENGLGLLVL